jgi:hypothetical protein
MKNYNGKREIDFNNRMVVVVVAQGMEQNQRQAKLEQL